MSTVQLSAKMMSAAAPRRLSYGIPSRMTVSRMRCPSARPLVVVFAEPEATASKIDLPKAVQEAKEACDDGTAEECATAWDTVEELSAAKSHKKEQQVTLDPLEEFCEDNPETDECRVYED